MTRPRAVVFDLDDTLYPERRFALSGYAAVSLAIERSTGVGRAECFRLLATALRNGRRRTAFQDVCEAFALDRSAVPGWLAIYRSHVPRLRLPPTSRATLETLRTTWRVGVLTNGLPGVQRSKVRSLGLHRLVDAVVYADELAPGGKPAPGPFAEVLRRLDTDSSRAVFVGDSQVTDVVGAHNAGLRSVWLCRPPGVRTGQAHAADARIHSLAELPLVLEQVRLGEVMHVA
jgi:putative hydrolase of the HAD superfamily